MPTKMISAPVLRPGIAPVMDASGPGYGLEPATCEGSIFASIALPITRVGMAP